MKKNLFLAAVALLALAACSNNEENAPAAPAQLQVTAGLGSDAATRGDGEVTWASSAKIVVNEYTNSSYLAKTWAIIKGEGETKASFSSSDTYRFTEGQEVNFSAFTSNSSTAPSVKDNGSIDVTATNANAPSDLYFATASASASSPVVQFAFTHAMAKLTIKLKKAEEAQVSDIKSATLKNFYTTGNVAKDGTVTASAESTNGVNLTNHSETGDDFVIIPTTQTLKLEVKAGDNTYYATINASFEKNKHYTYVIELKQTTLEVIGSNDPSNPDSEDTTNGSTISDWTSETSESISSTMVDK